MSNPFDELNTKLDKVLESNQEVKQLLLAKQTQGPEQADKPQAMNFNEACEYVDLSTSYMRFLCHKKEIPFYKPRGRKLYFKRSELDSWLLQKKSAVLSDEALRKAYK